MVYYVKVTKVVKNYRCCEVHWALNGRQMQTFFYHHSDGSWGCSPEFRKLDPSVQKYVLKRTNACLAEDGMKENRKFS